jgi:hypothetical protein
LLGEIESHASILLGFVLACKTARVETRQVETSGSIKALCGHSRDDADAENCEDDDIPQHVDHAVVIGSCTAVIMHDLEHMVNWGKGRIED